MTQIILDKEGAVAIITLRNPPQNRLSPEMLIELDIALDSVSSSEARALVLRADGADFSFGGDIQAWPTMTQRERRTLFERYLAAFNRFEGLSIPTVALVQGLCFGGGLELALRADVVFAGETARFSHPEQSIAIVTLLGGIYRVAERAGRSKAFEWALTSAQVPAEEMARYGVINRVLPDAELMVEGMAFAAKAAAGPTLAYAAHKALLRTWSSGGKVVADRGLMDIAMPLFESADARMAIPAAVDAIAKGNGRPQFTFKGK